MTAQLHRSPAAAQDVDRAREIVSRAQEVLGGCDLCPDFADADLLGADAALSAVRRDLTEHLEQGLSVPQRRPEAEALLLRSEHAQVAVKDAILAQHDDRVSGAQEAVGRLRGIASAAALAERAPIEAYRMGFSRILFSRIHQGTWVAFSGFAGADEEFAKTMVEVGLANPHRLDRRLLEGDMVRRGVPILVHDAQSNPRVHPELIAMTGTKTYVASPVAAWGKTVGLLHADRHTEEPGVHEFDRAVLGMFAQGLGIAFERNLLIERLHAMRKAADTHLRAAISLADDFTLEVMELAGEQDNSAFNGPEEQSRTRATSGTEELGPLGDLTAREAEVMRGLAAGKTNAQIAVSLFVGEGTVKSHVKHILRKLGAANRTDAVAKYHRLRA
ncbi:LuxR C-terminal-related transcriptional regulator [Mycobacterium sp. AT1]|uniref:LuxR C-terminal-related transcriptional regulator n=1 Tax=Mycobacterium sp. AT1 TaxID=1961706 RepID=UPI0009AE7ED6|nr:LuxR C-terminal-related transcriptional regulator [Mycobacterium sp. AT1]OPX10658.1 hypothetical protein B1790_11290 [Mycobacterium sp. AT1]